MAIGDGRAIGDAFRRCEEILCRHQRRDDGGVGFGGEEGERFAEATSGVLSRDDDEQVGKVECSLVVPIFCEMIDGVGEDGASPTGGESGDRASDGCGGGFFDFLFS